MSSIWKDLGAVGAVPPPREAAVGAALLGRLLSSATVVLGGGESPGRTFLAEVEAWCRAGWPRRWPRAKPRGWDDGLMFTGAALYAEHLATHYRHDPQLQEALGAAVERLAGRVG
jgi:hypothetical protein